MSTRFSGDTAVATRYEASHQNGLEGIVSKRLGSRYRSGMTPHWLKFEAPAVKREPKRIGGGHGSHPQGREASRSAGTSADQV
jgi:hypothetical protein